MCKEQTAFPVTRNKFAEIKHSIYSRIMHPFTNIDEYIATFPESTKHLLEQIRETIAKAAPAAEEAISYAMPTFKLHGNLVHFAGYKNHIGFYPGAGGIAAFQKEIDKYKNAKGSVQFPLDKPLPLALVTKITKYRVKQNIEKASLKAYKKSQRKK